MRRCELDLRLGKMGLDMIEVHIEEEKCPLGWGGFRLGYWASPVVSQSGLAPLSQFRVCCRGSLSNFRVTISKMGEMLCFLFDFIIHGVVLIYVSVLM